MSEAELTKLVADIALITAAECKKQISNSASQAKCEGSVTQSTRVQGFFGGNIDCSDAIVIGESVDSQNNECCSVSVVAKNIVDILSQFETQTPIDKLLSLLTGINMDSGTVERRDYTAVEAALKISCGGGGSVMQSATIRDILLANDHIECKNFTTAINETTSTVSCAVGNAAAAQRITAPKSFKSWNPDPPASGEAPPGITWTAIGMAIFAFTVICVCIIIHAVMISRTRRKILSTGQTGEFATLERASFGKIA